MEKFNKLDTIVPVDDFEEEGCVFAMGKRKFWIRGEINEDLFDLAMKIVKINQKDADIPVCDRKPITIYLTTPGGEAESTLVLTDIMNTSKTPITTIAMGDCQSAGAIILMTGHYRMALRNTDIMIHDVSTAMPNALKRKFLTEYISYFDKKFAGLADYIKDCTNVTDEDIKGRYTNEDYWMSAEEALEKGLIDAIVENIEDLY